MATDSDVCECCGSTERLVHDHDHDTMEFRGVLCSDCNSALGLLGDTLSDADNLVKYMLTRSDSVSIKVPIYVETGVRRKRKQFLNLNILRNSTHHTNNSVKKAFKTIVVSKFPDVYFSNFRVHYELYLPNKAKRDVSNVLSIVDKNFCDAWVESGRSPDDNYHHLQKISYHYGGYDENKDGYVIATVVNVPDSQMRPV